MGAFNRENVIGFTEPQLKGLDVSVVDAVSPHGQSSQCVIGGGDVDTACVCIFPLENKEVGVACFQNVDVVGVWLAVVDIIWIQYRRQSILNFSSRGVMCNLNIAVDSAGSGDVQPVVSGVGEDIENHEVLTGMIDCSVD